MCCDLIFDVNFQLRRITDPADVRFEIAFHESEAGVEHACVMDDGVDVEAAIGASADVGEVLEDRTMGDRDRVLRIFGYDEQGRQTW